MGHRSLAEPTERTAYLTSAPAPTSRAEMVRVAGRRWTVAASLQTAQGEVGLDHYAGRRWTGWYRHITWAMWAQAVLAVVRTATATDGAPKKGAQGWTTSLARFKAHRGLRSA
jgi:SRSO17 transposase